MPHDDDSTAYTLPLTALTCPSCGMVVAARALWLAPRHCPRCIARKRTAVELVGVPPAHRRTSGTR